MNRLDDTSRSSVRVDEKHRPAVLPWLLGLLLLALLALVLFFVLGDDDGDDTAAGSSVSQGSVEDEDLDADADADADVDAGADATEDAGASTDAAAGDGASGEPLVLTPPFADLARQEGRTVTVITAEVVDVPADEAFTIGTADSELLVHITPEARAGGGESATDVEPGSTLASLEGTLEPITDETLSRFQLEGDEADALRERGVYVAATSFELAAP